MKPPAYRTPFPAALCYAFAAFSFVGFLVFVAMTLKGDIETPYVCVGAALGALVWVAIGQIVERPFKKDHAEAAARWSPPPPRGGFINSSMRDR